MHMHSSTNDSMAHAYHACSPESIYVLTSQKLAQMADVPQCNPEELFVISAHSGQIFLKGSQEAELHNADRPHSAGAHSSPWYFAQVSSLLVQIIPAASKN